MNKKPWIFSLLSGFSFSLPFLTLAYVTFINELPVHTIVTNGKITLGLPYLFTFWALPILSGISLIAVKSFAFYMFLACQATLLIGPYAFENFFPDFFFGESKLFYISSSIITLSSIFIVSSKGLRKYFFSPGLRWWQWATRYQIEIPFTIRDQDKLIEAKILNASTSGIFFILMDDTKFSENQKVKCNISYEHFEIQMTVNIIKEKSFRGYQGYGAKFNFRGLWSWLQVQRFVSRLKVRSHDIKDISSTIEHKRAS